MYYTASASNNNDFITLLKKYDVIHSDKVEKAMRSVDRGHYVYPGTNPYEDCPQPLFSGQTISAPHMHAMCLEILENNLTPGAKVLDVGSGSGYLTAAMGMMVGETGKVIGIDVIPDLISFANANVKKDHPELLEKNIVEIKLGDGWKGCPEQAPFDAIHVGAAASSLPTPLLDQLKVGGTLVIPVGTSSQFLKKYVKGENGTFSEEVITGVRYVPLVPQS